MTNEKQQLLDCPLPKDEKRFKTKYIKHGDCWIWIGSFNGKKGYGKMLLRGKLELAHRISYSWYRGHIPTGMTIDHMCNNKACVNPEHLEVATQKDNNLRGNSLTAKNKRKTHCARGHEFTEDNVKIIIRRTSTRRVCKKCHRQNVRATKRRRRERTKQK